MAFTDSGVFNITAASNTALAVACAALTSGETVSFAPGTDHGLTNAQLEWQSHFKYDPTNKVCQLMGKGANNNNDWRLRTYDIATSTWSNNDFDFNRSGHIYGEWDLDPATGDIYMNPGTGDNRDLWRRLYSTGTWSILTTAWAGAGVSIDGSNPVVWHPNLFGVGVGGTVLLGSRSGTDRMGFWNSSNGAVTTTTIAEGTTSNGQGCYFAAIDAAVTGRTPHFIVTPNGGSLPNVVNAGAPPVPTSGTRSQDNCGVVLQHPGNSLKLLLLEKAGTNQLWESTDGDTWSLIGTHPFTTGSANPTSFCSLGDGLGCIWSIGYSSGLNSVLWRPPV